MNKIMAFILILIIIACNNKPYNAKEHRHDADEAMDSTSAAATHVDKRYATNEVLNSYFVLAEALVLAKDSLVSQAWVGFSTEITKAIQAKSPANAIPLLEKIKVYVETKKEVNVKAARGYLNDIQPNMYALTKLLKDETPVYRQFCLMAFSNKGAHWLSTDTIIRNPYFGDDMLDCGNVDEVIK
jgi:hypothetical protein